MLVIIWCENERKNVENTEKGTWRPWNTLHMVKCYIRIYLYGQNSYNNEKERERKRKEARTHTMCSMFLLSVRSLVFVKCVYSSSDRLLAVERMSFNRNKEKKNITQKHTHSNINDFAWLCVWSFGRCFSVYVEKKKCERI